MNKKGFTLIELLVTITIIAIIAAIAIASVGDGRDKARDTKIRATAGDIQSQLISLTRPSGILCEEDFYNHPDIIESLDQIDDVSPNPDQNEEYVQSINATNTVCGGDLYGSWALVFPLNEWSSDYSFKWCIDSNGNSGFVTDSSVSSTPYTCPITQPN